MVGMGYDAHRFDPERPLVLGGVAIPYSQGLMGHSDADVLVHAIMDALLGAAALGDIGLHFPDTDPAYRNVSSIKLLSRVAGLLQEKNYTLVNLDAVIIAQKPRLAPYMHHMKEEISRALAVPPGSVNVKATTTEGMGFTGREEGIAAAAVALIE
jgi:2-C-methyl-D-erythritol 2,4-cyclodiphosphate synthase